MGRPLPTSNLLILVVPASLLSGCFFATRTMLDRLSSWGRQLDSGCRPSSTRLLVIIHS